MARRVKQKYQSPLETSVRLVMSFFMALLTLVGTPSDAVLRPAIRIGLFSFHFPRHLVGYCDSLRRHFEQVLNATVQFETAPSVEHYTARMIRGDYDVALMPAHLGRLVQVDYRWQLLQFDTDGQLLKQWLYAGQEQTAK
jgi:hypothetical protein